MASKIQVSDEKLKVLSDQLLNVSGTTPLHTRFRALFTLKSIADARAVHVIAQGFADSSALLKHELAYVLGQMGEPTAIPVLESVLVDTTQDAMVRHESAEALAALSSISSLPLLRKYADPRLEGVREVRETCEIALAKIEWDNSEEAKAQSERLDRQFTSVDPAPPLIAHSPLVTPKTTSKGTGAITDVPALKAALLDTKLQLFTRYRAMFALRNIGTPEAIDALCDGFEDDSALFKHEIAFIMGQLSHPHSIPALLKVLRKTNESDMVRHEAAEALGGIPTSESDGGEVLVILRDWAAREEAPQVVRDSCVVAVDMWEYENSDQFQYADGLEGVANGGVLPVSVV